MIRDALGVAEGEHPTYEMMAAVVDRTADDVTREIVASHCEVCARCEEEMRDLRAFAGEAAPSVWPRMTAAAAVVIAVAAAGAWYVTRPRSESTPVVRPRATVVGGVASGYGRADWDAAVRDALARGAIDPQQHWPAADPLRGSGGEPPADMSPVAAIVDSATPLLTWGAKPGRYVVSVYDSLERVAQSPALQSAEWRVSPRLTRGKTYAWQVEARRGSSVELLPAPPSPPALFHVLDERSSADLAEARRRFPDDHLLLGVLEARSGLQQEALADLRAYAARHPDDRKAAALAESVAHW
jgi:hypothetical protein